MFFEGFSRKKADLSFGLSEEWVYLVSLTFLFLITGVLLVVFVIRLFNLTVVHGEYYKRLSDENRIREIVVESQRGRILDRKGFVIAENTPAQIDEEEKRFFSRRKYRYSSAPHFIGYVSEADEKDLRVDLCPNRLQIQDRVGRMGVEKVFDCLLRGRHGKQLLEVDSVERTQRKIAFEDPEPGMDITVSLDIQWQEKVHKFITSSSQYRDKKIAVAGLDPRSGEVLLYLSYPDFDAQMFVDKRFDEISRLFNDEKKPFLDRVANASYPPGSVFKMAVAIAALQEKAIEPDTLIEDTGQVKLGPRVFSNWLFTKYGRTDGLVDISKAIQRSNDIFFYKTGERLGVKNLRKWIYEFGFGQATGVGFAEDEGIVPSDFWKREVIGERWFTGDTYNLSIGQGYLLTTPLQVAQYSAVFANGGKLCKPLILKTSFSPASSASWVKEMISDYNTPSCRKLEIEEENLKLVREAMRLACKPGGTGAPFFEFEPEVGCKTGTAESYGGKAPHAWFVVFAPFEKPEVLLTVLVEKSGEGSQVAAPLAKKILEFYFQRQD